jgi:hypothetical protein
MVLQSAVLFIKTKVLEANDIYLATLRPSVQDAVPQEVVTTRLRSAVLFVKTKVFKANDIYLTAIRSSVQDTEHQEVESSYYAWEDEITSHLGEPHILADTRHQYQNMGAQGSSYNKLQKSSAERVPAVVDCKPPHDRNRLHRNADLSRFASSSGTNALSENLMSYKTVRFAMVSLIRCHRATCVSRQIVVTNDPLARRVYATGFRRNLIARRGINFDVLNAMQRWSMRTSKGFYP